MNQDDWSIDKQSAWTMYWSWLLDAEEAARRGDQEAEAEAKAEADYWYNQWAWLD